MSNLLQRSITRLHSALPLLLKVALAGVLTLLLLELVLIAFNDRIFEGAFVYDGDIGFRMRPDIEVGPGRRTNEFGFNDRDYPHSPPPGAVRILVLGDSFNWAQGARNYIHLLEESLENRPDGISVEVINVGYPGTHSHEQFLALKKFGLRYNPHLVILAFFLGNDFVEAEPWRKRIVVGGSFADIHPLSWPPAEILGQPVLMRSRLLLLLRDQGRILRRNLELQFEKWSRPKSSKAEMTFSTDFYLRLEHARMQIANRTKESEFGPHTDYVFESLSEIRATLDSRSIDFIVVGLPDEFQISPELRRAVLSRFEEDASQYRWDRASEILKDFCSRLGVGYYDLTPAFSRAHQGGAILYAHNDSHWNAAGNELAAGELFEILNGIVPGIAKRHAISPR